MRRMPWPPLSRCAQSLTFFVASETCVSSDRPAVRFSTRSVVLAAEPVPWLSVLICRRATIPLLPLSGALKSWTPLNGCTLPWWIMIQVQFTPLHLRAASRFLGGVCGVIPPLGRLMMQSLVHTSVCRVAMACFTIHCIPLNDRQLKVPGFLSL